MMCVYLIYVEENAFKCNISTDFNTFSQLKEGTAWLESFRYSPVLWAEPCARGAWPSVRTVSSTAGENGPSPIWLDAETFTRYTWPDWRFSSRAIVTLPDKEGDIINLLKELPVAEKTLLNIINSSLSLGHVPKPFKLAVIKPLIKKPKLDPCELANYRHIYCPVVLALATWWRHTAQRFSSDVTECVLSFFDK